MGVNYPHYFKKFNNQNTYSSTSYKFEKNLISISYSFYTFILLYISLNTIVISTRGRQAKSLIVWLLCIKKNNCTSRLSGLIFHVQFNPMTTNSMPWQSGLEFQIAPIYTMIMEAALCYEHRSVKAFMVLMALSTLLQSSKSALIRRRWGRVWLSRINAKGVKASPMHYFLFYLT